MFAEFPQAEWKKGVSPGQFGSAQLEDPILEQARQNLVVVMGECVERLSVITFPHFAVKNGLLYRVVNLLLTSC